MTDNVAIHRLEEQLPKCRTHNVRGGKKRLTGIDTRPRIIVVPRKHTGLRVSKRAGEHRQVARQKNGGASDGAAVIPTAARQYSLHRYLSECRYFTVL